MQDEEGLIDLSLVSRVSSDTLYELTQNIPIKGENMACEKIDS